MSEKDLKWLIQFVEIGKARNKVFREIGEKGVSQICKLDALKRRSKENVNPANYHIIDDLVGKGLVEFVDQDKRCYKKVQLTSLGRVVFEKIDGVEYYGIT